MLMIICRLKERYKGEREAATGKKGGLQSSAEQCLSCPEERGGQVRSEERRVGKECRGRC